jgi:uncharacterized protein (TIGR02453 family)
VRQYIIQKTTLDFLKKLAAHNDRDWFNEHKDQYEKAKGNTEAFMDALIAKMSAHDRLETPSGKKSLFRIYNDARFAKSKAPYNPRFAAHLKRSKPLLRGGYYIRIRPGESRVACGFMFPNADDMKRIREDIAANYTDWKKLLKTKSIVQNFGQIQGEQVKTTPKGFSSSDPAIELLRYKQFWFERKFTDREVLADDFLNNVNTTLKAIRPFFDYMSELLTTDSNGESLY